MLIGSVEVLFRAVFRKIKKLFFFLKKKNDLKSQKMNSKVEIYFRFGFKKARKQNTRPNKWKSPTHGYVGLFRLFDFVEINSKVDF